MALLLKPTVRNISRGFTTPGANILNMAEECISIWDAMATTLCWPGKPVLILWTLLWKGGAGQRISRALKTEFNGFWCHILSIQKLLVLITSPVQDFLRISKEIHDWDTIQYLPLNACVERLYYSWSKSIFTKHMGSYYGLPASLVLFHTWRIETVGYTQSP